MNSSRSFPISLPRQIATSVQPPESSSSSSVRRIRKELFVDSNRVAAAAQDHCHHPMPPLTPTTDVIITPSSASSFSDDSTPIDAMDIWRTYTKRSIDDRQGRAPLTCIWNVGSAAEEGQVVECGYGATPKLMRRHVQTTHMHIK
ncbi:hypothetical protein D9757_010304 [Collybiopsis confluens]|uniref:Uncharacterized protein n=1 Tax=Collybiopsis confluens TaxID=2823264 RepID=A0A8H5GU05_9AGAR|nr:hypothetical protein D9757_010304 [Collybiopsis confluens]